MIEDYIGMNLEEIQDESIRVEQECDALERKRTELEAERDTLRKRLIDIDAELRETNRRLKMKTDLWQSFNLLEVECQLKDAATEGIKRYNTMSHWYVD